MDKEHLQAIGTVIGAAAAALVAWLVGRKEARKPAEPPPERPPTQNETKAALESLRERIDHNHGLADDDRREMQRQLDRIERDVGRICDRLDADARIGDALAKLHRQVGG